MRFSDLTPCSLRCLPNSVTDPILNRAVLICTQTRHGGYSRALATPITGASTVDAQDETQHLQKAHPWRKRTGNLNKTRWKERNEAGVYLCALRLHMIGITRAFASFVVTTILECLESLIGSEAPS